MAGAYAALVSLLNTLNQIQNHPSLSTCFDKYQNKSLREKVDLFLDFVGNYSDADNKEVDDLVRRIAVAAHEAEDIIEVEAADRIRGVSTQHTRSFLPHLQMTIEDMDCIEKNVMKLKQEIGFITRSSVPPPSSSPPPLATTKTTMLGFDGYVVQLLDELTGLHSGRRILPIVGMGGIGKTTLARNVYDNLLMVHHFDVRAWVTVSQEYNAREIILQSLSCLGGSACKTDATDDQLGQELYRILLGRRYLIILDDVWNIEAWERTQFFFPDNNNGSRIVVTTRQLELVDYFGSSPLVVNFLDDKNSWELFCEKTFSQQGCPHPELEQVGKKIVDKCKGLPLAIVVIGGLLRKSSRTRECWETIAKDTSLILDSGEGNKLLSLLYLSYKYLPVCLKPCFLYLGLFPEDHEIFVSFCIKLWVAEGLIRPQIDQSLEQVAECFVKELLDRNLLIVRRLRQNRKLVSCGVHDLVRGMCLRIAEKENLVCAERDIDGMRHFIVDQTSARSYLRQFQETPSLVCPLILEEQRATAIKSRLLRVMFRDKHELEYSFRQVNLRFLFNQSLNVGTYSLPSSISLLWGLQTLVLVGGNVQVVAPSEIWKMTQLRHVEVEMWSIYLPDPLHSGDQDGVLVLRNLQTLKRVEKLNFTEETCERIPNIKELHIHYDSNGVEEASWCYHLQNIGCLNKLESLRYSCSGWECVGDSLQNLKLPSSLKELTLEGCNLVWSDMAMIASLPRLLILELLEAAVTGPEWNSVEQEFECLKHLRISGCDLISWVAETSNFPVLETLDLEYLSKLENIPSTVGEIPTLERIYMYGCRESATISAVEILDEQENLGNQNLHLQLEFFDSTRTKVFGEKTARLGFACQNLHVSSFVK